MGYPITDAYIQGLPQTPYDHGAGHYEFVELHATAVFEDTAMGERNYEARCWQDAFVGSFVDWQTILRTAPAEFEQWGAGHTANQKAYHIEQCQTQDPAKFRETYARWTWYAAYMIFTGVETRPKGVIDGVTLRSHAQTSATWHETDHTDPCGADGKSGYLGGTWGITWAQVVADVTKWFNQMVAEEQATQQRGVVQLDEGTKQAALKAIDFLHEKGLISSPDYWKQRIEENMPVWAYMIIEARDKGIQL